MYDTLKDPEVTLETLEETDKNTAEDSVTLSGFTYEFDQGEDEPHLTDGFNKYYFDIENTFALEQLCTWLKIKQFKFFNKRSKELQQDIVKECIGDISKGRNNTLLKLRNGGTKSYIRAVLHSKHTPVKNSEVLAACQENVAKKDLHAFRCRGYGLDEPSVNFIYTLKDFIEVNNKKFYLGFDIISSELGDYKFELNANLYDETEDVYYKITFNKDSYLTWKYKKDEPDFPGIIGDLVATLQSRKNEIKKGLEEMFEEFYQNNEELHKYFDYLELNKVGPEKVIKELKRIVFDDPQYYKTKYDLANFISHLATEVEPSDKDNKFWRGKTLAKVNKIETFAGTIMCLDLNL